MYVLQIKTLTDIMHEHKCMYLQMSTQRESERSAVYLIDKSENQLEILSTFTSRRLSD